MKKITNATRLAGIASLLLASSFPQLSASTVVFQTGGTTALSDIKLAHDASSDLSSLFVTESFVLSTSLSQVSIFANLSNTSGVLAAASVFLTTQVGTGTTVSNQVGGAAGLATVNVENGAHDVLTTLFSGLNLSAGTYFVTFASASSNLVAIEASSAATAAVVSNGVSAGKYGEAVRSAQTYDPAALVTTSALTSGPGAKDVFITVTTPEPMSFGLMALGLAGIGWRFRRARS